MTRFAFALSSFKKRLSPLGAVAFFLVVSPTVFAADQPQVALYVTEWAKSATGGGTQVPSSDEAIWTLMVTLKNLSAQELNNVQIQCSMYKRIANGTIVEMDTGGNRGGAFQAQAMNPMIVRRGGRMVRAMPQHDDAPKRAAETISLRVGEMKQIKVEGTVGGNSGSGAIYRQQNFTGRGGSSGQPLPTQQPNASSEKYVGFSVVVIYNGEVIARQDRNPERLNNFGIGRDGR